MPVDASALGAEHFVPDSRRLRELAEAAAGCRGCDLYRDAIQTVFGEGRADAPLILVGEQPGDFEDKEGVPFVGPAGRVLWKCVAAAGIERDDVFVTNAVKHFKHEVRGKRRLHKRPNTAEIEACHPWLAAELDAVRARVVVAMGAIAARSLLGRTVPIEKSRGTAFDVDGRTVFVTYHPSAVLRADEEASRIRAAIVHDLHAAARSRG
jgi:DNA polymerase